MGTHESTIEWRPSATAHVRPMAVQSDGIARIIWSLMWFNKQPADRGIVHSAFCIPQLSATGNTHRPLMSSRFAIRSFLNNHLQKICIVTRNLRQYQLMYFFFFFVRTFNFYFYIICFELWLFKFKILLSLWRFFSSRSFVRLFVSFIYLFSFHQLRKKQWVSAFCINPTYAKSI